MIPRLKPTIGLKELGAALRFYGGDDIRQFESGFAELMGQKHALAFPYGRSGLIFLIQALGIENKEIICPSYTCIVVPHAIVYSGNKPLFVDCAPGHFNMDLDQAAERLSDETGAIIATSLFGYPVDLDCLERIREVHPDVAIIQDCAHSFAAEWKGRPVQTEGTASIFGLNISKLLTSVFGGMVTTDDEKLYARLKKMRDAALKPAGGLKELRRLFYLMAVYPVFWPPLYGMVNRMERGGLLNYFTRYYDESKIDMPADVFTQMANVEARVGKVNIDRYMEIIHNRRAAARCFFEHLPSRGDFKMPPEIEGATYSHFVVQVKDRQQWLQAGLKASIQLGELIDYHIPEMTAYGNHRAEEFPVGAAYARTTINLPVWGGRKTAERTITQIRKMLESD
jgi:dTDP-4-amino-4,6-dideoxygalactose transaminase